MVPDIQKENPDAAKVKEKKCGSALDTAQGESYEKTERKTAHSLCANSSSIAEAILTTAEYAGDSVKDPTTGDSMPSSQLHVKAKKKLLGLPYPYGRPIHVQYGLWCTVCRSVYRDHSGGFVVSEVFLLFYRRYGSRCS